MPYPIYTPLVGKGMIIGVNAVIHVLISHGVAVGLFGMLVLADWQSAAAPAEVRPAWNALVHRMLRFLVLVATIGGAVTGAGIWFTTGALASHANASMLRIFFWPWFIEWIVFFLEVVAILIYYYFFDRLADRRRLRLALGAGYAGSGIVAAVLITGTLGFMLTPGSWLVERQLLGAFLNPSFWPQLITRLAFGYALGAILGLILAHTGRGHEASRAPATRLFGGTLLVTVPILALGLLWYAIEIPRAFGERAAYSVLTEHLSQRSWIFYGGNLAGFGILLLLGILSLVRRARAARWLIIPAAIYGVAFVSQYERIREFIRGPYVMPGYMYVSGVLVQEQPTYDAEGMLGGYWSERDVHDGDVLAAAGYLFAQNCSVCHTSNGVNPIERRVRERSEDGIRVILRHTQEMTSFMPPLVGTEDERMITARFLYLLGNGEIELESRPRFRPVVRTEDR